MGLRKFNWNFKFSICLLIVSIFVIITTTYFLDGYGSYEDVHVEVIDKIPTQDEGVYGGRSDKFYLIVKRIRDGKNFDIIVTPTTFSQAEMGEHLIFNLRPFDIEQNILKNILFLIKIFSILAFILSVIMFFITFGNQYKTYD